MRFAVFCLMIVLACQAQAGAWPREKGEGFLSFSTEYDTTQDRYYTALFIEYGITPRLTGGIDFGMDDEELHKAIAFGRLPLIASDKDWKIAFEMGLGLTEDEAVLRPGVLLGRSLSFGDKSGWFAVESLIYYQIEEGEVNVSTDVTLGLNMTQKMKLLMQLQAGNHMMKPDYLNLAPSVVVEKAPGLHLELGMKTGLKDGGDYAIKLGIWHTF